MKHIEIDFSTGKTEEKIRIVREIINENRPAEFDFDMRQLNLINAVKLVTLLSTEIYLKSPLSKINLKVEDKEALKILQFRKLKNTFLGDTLNKNKECSQRKYVSA